MSKLAFLRRAVSFLFVIFLAIVFAKDGKAIFYRIRDAEGIYVCIALIFSWANFNLALLRYLCSFRILGIGILLQEARRSFIAGQIGALSFGGPVTQALARQLFMQVQGVTPASLSVLGVVERAITLVTLITIAAVAALYSASNLLPPVAFRETGTALVLQGLAFATICAAFAQMAPRQFRASLRRLSKAISIPAILLTACASIASHLAMLGVFVSVFRAFGGEINFTIISALCIVMFVAALPLSFSGWGIREVAAAYMLMRFGYSEDIGIAVGLLVGVISLVPLILSVGMQALARSATTVKESPVSLTSPITIDRPIIVLCSAVVGALLLFPIRISFGHHSLNVNLADMVGIVALVTVIASVALQPRKLHIEPRAWALAIGLLTLLVVYAVTVALVKGPAPWGLMNRGLGWIAILSYAAFGQAIRFTGTTSDIWNVIEGVVVVNCLVSCIQLACFLISIPEQTEKNLLFRIGWHAFSGDANAYALVCVLSLISWCALRVRAQPTYRSALVGIVLRCAPSILFAGVLASKSRMGYVLLLVAVSSALLLPHCRRPMLSALFVGVLLSAVLPVGINYGYNFIIRENSTSADIVRLVSEHSDVERIQTVRDGLQLWADNPITGAGFGGYMAERLSRGDKPQVIHNIYVWLLAEAGIIGIGLAASALLVLARELRAAFQKRGLTPALFGFTCTLICFLAGGLVHDLFYQRAVWLLLGLFAAVIAAERSGSGSRDEAQDPNTRLQPASAR